VTSGLQLKGSIFSVKGLYRLGGAKKITDPMEELANTSFLGLELL
jgi:hypothetical protein